MLITVTGLGALRDQTNCKTMMGIQTLADCVSAAFSDGDLIDIGDIHLEVIYSPGHTDDSYSFYASKQGHIIYWGHLVNSWHVGRTDFQKRRC